MYFLSLDLAHQQHLGREVVAVTIQVRPARECAQRITLAATLGVAQKIVIVHVDLVTGLSASREIAVDFIRTATQADGIISTRPNFIRRAKELHMYTILRVFVIDSMALSSLENLEKVRPDFLEVLPRVMPKTIRQICKRVHTPVLTGGLIADKEDVMNALNAGAMAISTTNPAVWCL